MTSATERQALSIVTQPVEELVTVEEVVAFAKMGEQEDESLLLSLTELARVKCEAFCARAFITTTFRWWVDAGLLTCDHLYLPRAPIVSLDAIKQYDEADTETAFATSKVLEMFEGNQRRITLNEGESWPSGLRDYWSMYFEFKAGYGDREAVPAPIKAAVKYLTAHWFEDRDALGRGDIPPVVRAFLGPYRTLEVV